MITASFLSSLSALCVYLPIFSGIISILIKIPVCFLTAFLAFFSGNLPDYFKSVLLTIAITLLYGGFFIAIYELFKPPNMAIINDVVYFEYSPFLMIGLSLGIYLVLFFVRKLLSKRISNTIVSLKFSVFERSYECLAKIDTACSATEPFSQAPVIIAEKKLFDASKQERKRVIPYRTLSGESLMYAVRADEVYIDRQKIQKEIYIASAALVETDFQAIINSNIIR